MFSPRISVILPVYNGEPYLALAMESLLSQTFGDFELVLIDDGSTDASPQLIAHYARTDHRIRTITHPANRGPVAALNTGLAAASAPWLARFDQDDLCLPERLQWQWEYLQSHPAVGLLGSSLELIDAAGGPAGSFWYPETHDQIYFGFHFGNCLADPSVIVNRHLLEHHQPRYDAAFTGAEDYAMWTALLPHTRAANLHRPVVRYRLHAAQMSQCRAGESESAAGEVAKGLLARLALEPPPRPPLRRALLRLYRHLLYAITIGGGPDSLHYDSNSLRHGSVEFSLSLCAALSRWLRAFLAATGSGDYALHAIAALPALRHAIGASPGK